MDARVEAGDDLYRREEIDEAVADGSTIFIVQTAKDAENLWSRKLPATCCAGGAEKWRPEYSRALTGAEVVLVEYTGALQHLDQIGKALGGIAKSIWVLDSKYIEAGVTTDELWTHIGRWVATNYLSAARPLM